MSEIKAKRQPSRKGKKAWRKNVDIQDIESKLQDIRDEEIVKGKSHHGKEGEEGEEEEQDFVIDTTPSAKHVESTKAPKKLKTHEILTNKSKVEPLVNKRATKSSGSKVQGVKKTEMLRLLKMRGGKYRDENIALNRAGEDGLINGDEEDLWGNDSDDDDDGDASSKKKTGKFPHYNTSTAEVTKATTVPKTLREKPIQINKNDLTDKFVHAGKSYNPSLESWKDLIDQEYDIEHKRELNRQAMEEHRARVRELMVTLKDDFLSDDENDEEEEEEEEEMKTKQDSETVAETEYSLSINKPNKIKIKTKSKRNKEAKHKKRVQLEQEIKNLKKQLHDLANLDELLAKQQEQQDGEEPPAKKQRSAKRNKLFKYTPIQTPLEVKLSDELTSSLKNLKPEGNLFYDQMLNLQSSGKIESRVPVNKKRKYPKKVTEKWTYKDFK
ncbi:uncharacterized protein LODBEIA_P01080 [Lodderomyces beijingensis]|uniref:Ribosome biogenesis protein NOP53 n=1 Tax=Lodderomyces beijingensis TaxID=1775926 RepID=A0ABP0ZDB9_9ASCO